jgi:hypothetical protein
MRLGGNLTRGADAQPSDRVISGRWLNSNKGTKSDTTIRYNAPRDGLKRCGRGLRKSRMALVVWEDVKRPVR